MNRVKKRTERPMQVRTEERPSTPIEQAGYLVNNYHCAAQAFMEAHAELLAARMNLRERERLYDEARAAASEAGMDVMKYLGHADEQLRAGDGDGEPDTPVYRWKPEVSASWVETSR